MHDDDNPRREFTTAEADDRDQEGILAHLIAEHPDQLTITERAREMRLKEDTALIPDWLERGVRDLIALGAAASQRRHDPPDSRGAPLQPLVLRPRRGQERGGLTRTPAASRRPGRRPQGGCGVARSRAASHPASASEKPLENGSAAAPYRAAGCRLTAALPPAPAPDKALPPDRAGGTVRLPADLTRAETSIGSALWPGRQRRFRP
jgi:hypothetical protein